jgi:hypothetical protein
VETTKLVAFMRERHNIYERKTILKLPQDQWTTDPVLKAYRFCNVYRELDSVTIWVRENIREPFAEHPHLWFMLCAARQINHPATLAELIADKKAWPHGKSLNAWQPERMRAIMNDRKARGEQVYTGAYMLTNVLKKDDPRPKDKPWFTAHQVLGSLLPLEANIVQRSRVSMRWLHEALRQGYGWAGFMSYEVACDMRWTRYGQHWGDVDTFAHAGPGAKRGLNRLAGLPKDAPLKEDAALTAMQLHLRAARKAWPKKWPKLELREIEHSLCEYDKWERVNNGEGSPRSKYRPANNVTENIK